MPQGVALGPKHSSSSGICPFLPSGFRPSLTYSPQERCPLTRARTSRTGVGPQGGGELVAGGYCRGGVSELSEGCPSPARLLAFAYRTCFCLHPLPVF